MSRWTLTTHDGEGLLLTQQRADEWEARAKVQTPAGEIKVQAFGPTEADAYDCCMRNLLEACPP